jgi:hypothetical protein
MPAGTVTLELLAIEKIPINKSEVSSAGIVVEGAVMLVELALPCPLLASIGVTVDAPT